MSKDFDSMAEKAKKVADETTQDIKERFSKLKEAPEIEEMKKLASELAEDAAVFVKKYPIQSVLGAAAVGFLLGSLLNRKR